MEMWDRMESNQGLFHIQYPLTPKNAAHSLCASSMANSLVACAWLRVEGTRYGLIDAKKQLHCRQISLSQESPSAERLGAIKESTADGNSSRWKEVSCPTSRGVITHSSYLRRVCMVKSGFFGVSPDSS